MNTNGHAQPIQHLVDLSAAPIVRADDPDRLDDRSGRPRPLAEVLGDRAVELLVAWTGRLGEHRVDDPQGNRSRHRRHLVAAQAPLQQQHAASRPRHVPHPGEDVHTIRHALRQIGQHHRHRTARRNDLGQSCHGDVTARHDLEPIVPPIPIQLVTKPRSLRTVLRDDQDHRLHDCGVARRRALLGTEPASAAYRRVTVGVGDRKRPAPSAAAKTDSTPSSARARCGKSAPNR